MIIDISKDGHTRRFFPEREHIGPIEGYFHLDCPSVRSRIFAGRRAIMLTGERVLLLEQMKTKHSGPTVEEGTVFVGDATLLHYFESFPTAPSTVEFWRRELFEKQRANSLLLRAQPLPTYAGRLARCFLPPFSGLGALIWERNEASLIDLRSPKSAHRITIENRDSFDGECVPDLRFDVASREPWQINMTRFALPLEVIRSRHWSTSEIIDHSHSQFRAKL